MVSAVKGWIFNLSCFLTNGIFLSQVSFSQSIVNALFMAVGIILFSVAVGACSELFFEKILKLKDKWNGIGKQRFTRQGNG